MKKQVLPILLLLLMSLCVGAMTAQTPAGALNLTLIADYSNGFSGGDMDETQMTVPLESEPASPSVIALALADGLSDWTGLDFKLNDVSFPDEDSIVVDWSKDSTFLAGLDGYELNEGFRTFDAVSLNWFMMDSLAITLKYNLKLTTVYYQSDGQPLTFPNPEEMAAQGLPVLPVDQPYEGSEFFVSHAGGQGEDDALSTEDEPIAEGVFTNSILTSDPGENLTPFDAASGLFNLILKEELVQGTDYSKAQPMFITCVDVIDIEGKECYLLSVSGAFNTKAWEYAVDYNAETLNVYLISENGNQLLGSLLDLGQGDKTAK